MGMNDTMAKITKEQTDRVIKAVQDHYFGEAPPPKFVKVDLRSVRHDKVDPSYYCAKATIEVDTAAGTKSHTVHIRFRLDAKNRLVAPSIGYL